MSTRWGPGPVFVWEWIRASRRWQMYALRAFCLGLLLVAILYVWLTIGSSYSSEESAARAAESIYFALVGTQLTFVLLFAPVAAADAFCLEKMRGDLLHLFVTDLSDTEIVLGKLFTRLLPILGWVLSTLPVLCLAMLLGGIDPEAIIGAYLVTLGVALIACTLALTFSAWKEKMHDVIIHTYIVEMAWLFLSWIISSSFLPTLINEFAFFANPYLLAFAPYSHTARTDIGDAVKFLVFACAVSSVLVLRLICLLRQVTLRETGKLSAKHNDRTVITYPRHFLPQPSLDGNPVLWFECRPRRIRLFRYWGKFVYGLAILVITLCAFVADWPHGGGGLFSWLSGILAVQVLLGLLFVSIRSATALEEERSPGNLDVLLSTPLSSREIVLGKWRAQFRKVLLLTILPALSTLPFAYIVGFSSGFCLSA